MKWLLLVIGAIVLLFAAGSSEIVRTLLVGWIGFLGETLPKATVNPPAIVSGVAIFALFTACVHGFARRCCRALPAEPGAPRRPWPWRWTFSIVLGVFLTFAVGYCTVGLARHVGWVLSSPEPLQGEWLSGASYRLGPRGNLSMIGMGFQEYKYVYKQLPPGGTFDAEGNMLHSWETLLLPYLWYQHNIDMKLPWNHPANAKYFKSLIPEFINMDFRTQELFDAEGYGLSHYAANSRVLRANAAVKPEQMTNGASNTILIGEVNHAFRPWGYPANWRDPATGINQPNGFGGPPGSRGAQFLMLDGSVRFLSQNTDRQVLKALSTPTADEK